MSSPGATAGSPPARSRRRGCLGGVLIGLGVLVAAAVGVVVGLVVLSYLTGGETRSGNALAGRPAAAGPRVTVPPPDPPASSRGVQPVPDDRFVVSVVTGAAADPCGRSGPDLDLATMSVRGGTPQPLAPRGGDGSLNTAEDEVWPRLSPDRARVLFYRTPRGASGETCRYPLQELWLAEVDGSGVRRVFSNEQKLEVARQQGWPADRTLQGHAEWAPDGRHVVMVLGWIPSLGPLPLVNEGETQLFVLDTETGDLRQVTRRRDARGRGITSDPSWAPDGRTIVFVGCPDARPSCQDVQIRTVPADADRTAESSLVFDAPGRGANDVYVSPDGRSVSWMELGVLGTKLYVAKWRPGAEVHPDDAVLVDARGGYANWTPDSRSLIYTRLWLSDRFALFSNSFDDRPSLRLSPSPTSESFPFLST